MRRSFLPALVLLIACPVAAQGDRELELGSMGMFFLGGSRVEDANLSQAEWIGQSLVHYLTPKVSSRSMPIVFYPGQGLSSYIYLTTPDDRDGWAQIFVRAGFDVYVYDPVNTDPSTLPTIEFRLVEDGRASRRAQVGHPLHLVALGSRSVRRRAAPGHALPGR